MSGFEEVRRLLPQSYPFIFVDRILEHEPERRIRCLKNVTAAEPCFAGHFPDMAVYPGNLLLESFAQSAILLFRKSRPELDPPPIFLLGTVRARFLLPVFPGDQVILDVEVEKAIDTGAVVAARATVDGREVATARMTFAMADAARLGIP